MAIFSELKSFLKKKEETTTAVSVLESFLSDIDDPSPIELVWQYKLAFAPFLTSSPRPHKELVTVSHESEDISKALESEVIHALSSTANALERQVLVNELKGIGKDMLTLIKDFKTVYNKYNKYSDEIDILTRSANGKTLTLSECGSLIFRCGLEEQQWGSYSTNKPLLPEDFQRAAEGYLAIFEFFQLLLKVHSVIRRHTVDTKVEKEKDLLADIFLNPDFVQCVGHEEAARTCIKLLRHFGLTSENGTHCIQERSKWQLLAFTEALQHKKLLPTAKRATALTKVIAKQIHLEYRNPRKDNGLDEHLFRCKINEFLSDLNTFSTGTLTWATIAERC